MSELRFESSLTMEEIENNFKKGQKQKIVDYAQKHNKSVTQFIIELIDREMNK